MTSAKASNAKITGQIETTTRNPSGGCRNRRGGVDVGFIREGSEVFAGSLNGENHDRRLLRAMGDEPSGWATLKVLHPCGRTSLEEASVEAWRAAGINIQ